MYRYSDIIQPEPGDGRVFQQHDSGYFRGVRLASVGHRLLAFAIDLIPVYVLWKIFDLIVPEKFRALDGVADFIGFWLAVGLAALNLVWLQSKTGQSLGKMLLGMLVVRPIVNPMNMEEHYYVYPTMWLMTGRAFAHYFLDLFFLVGLLFMAKSPHRLSLADRVCNTLVLRPRDMGDVTIHRGIAGARDR